MSNEYELIKFSSNWADEMDITAFYIKPKGYLKELLSLQEIIFKRQPVFTIYVGSNQDITFTEKEDIGSGHDTFENSFSSQEMSLEEKNIFDKFFKDLSRGFGEDVLYNIEESLFDVEDLDFINPTDYPAFHSLISDYIVS